MTRITAILHTHNDALRIARAVESLRSCDEVLVIDHGSSDETRAMAQRFGARVLETQDKVFETQAFLPEAKHDWVFCLQPTESLSEGLEASLLEWKLATHPAPTAFAVPILGETPSITETRLVNRLNSAWKGWKPLLASKLVLEGHLLRMVLP
jgi:glycosyltransferase involved in cell wall biosynthesis